MLIPTHLQQSYGEAHTHYPNKLVAGKNILYRPTTTLSQRPIKPVMQQKNAFTLWSDLLLRYTVRHIADKMNSLQ